MRDESYNKALRELNLDYPAVAIKFCFEKPDAPHYDGPKTAFCEFVSIVQKTKKSFYITAEDDTCNGKLVLGMEDKSPVTCSGIVGYDFEIYRSPSANRALYQNLPVIEKGTVKYVLFAPAESCDFDPELVMFVAPNEQADIIMRATSYINGEPWESKSTPVISCGWMYSYPVISGKINHITTGFYHGLKRRGTYPAGLRMIAIPYQKQEVFFAGLKEMPKTPIAFRTDEESQAELAKRMAHWQELATENGTHCHIKALEDEN